MPEKVMKKVLWRQRNRTQGTPTSKRPREEFERRPQQLYIGIWKNLKHDNHCNVSQIELRTANYQKNLTFPTEVAMNVGDQVK